MTDKNNLDFIFLCNTILSWWT